MTESSRSPFSFRQFARIWPYALIAFPVAGLLYRAMTVRWLRIREKQLSRFLALEDPHL